MQATAKNLQAESTMPASDGPPSAAATMTAIVYDSYGSPDQLELRDVPTPSAADGEVLIRVVAAGLHIGDCFGVRGTPVPVRIVTGLFKPKRGIPGFDVAGVVEAVGPNVTRFAVGDAVFGSGHGTCAEYVCAPQGQLAAKPPSLSFPQAAALPTSGLAALHGLRDAGKIEAGQRVLINGASGGVGTFAVQIAVALGAEVTGVCSTSNIELVRSLGAAHVVDYTQQDFTDSPQKYDLVFDNVENRSLSDCRRALTPQGTLVLNSGTGATGLRMFARQLAPILLSPFVRHTLRRYLSVAKHDDLNVLGELVETGKLRPVIDKSYALANTRAALAHIERGHARGKVVVTV